MAPKLVRSTLLPLFCSHHNLSKEKGSVYYNITNDHLLSLSGELPKDPHPASPMGTRPPGCHPLHTRRRVGLQMETRRLQVGWRRPPARAMVTLEGMQCLQPECEQGLWLHVHFILSPPSGLVTLPTFRGRD